jgi:ribosome biogenesis GTPase
MSKKHDRGKFAADRYLDDEKFAGKWRRSDTKKLKKGPDAQESLPWEEANATVSELFKGMCRVVLDSEPREILCTYRRKQIWGQATGRDEDVRERSPVCVGDRVKVQVLGSKDGIVEGACQRRNQLARPAPERDEVIHVLVSNLDALVIVTAAAQPDFSPGLVDRFMVAAAKQGIPCILVINKIELWNGSSKPWDLYRGLGVPVFETSAKKGPGVEALASEIEGKHVAFCGHSGVGKTSLLNALIGQAVGATGDVNDFTGKGKHTTTGARLVMAGKGAFWVDTPGVRSFGLLGVDERNLHELFPEFRTAGCALGENCLHQGEEGCAAVPLPRYESYRRILTAINEET